MALDVMMKQHQELKAKVDGRSKTIQQCADLGKILIAAGNPASEEVSQTYEQCVHIVKTHNKMYAKLNRDVETCSFSHDCNLSVNTDKREVGQPSV